MYIKIVRRLFWGTTNEDLEGCLFDTWLQIWTWRDERFNGIDGDELRFFRRLLSHIWSHPKIFFEAFKSRICLCPSRSHIGKQSFRSWGWYNLRPCNTSDGMTAYAVHADWDTEAFFHMVHTMNNQITVWGSQQFWKPDFLLHHLLSRLGTMAHHAWPNS